MSIHELQAAVKALETAEVERSNVDDEVAAVLDAARRVAEGAGEPVAWLCVAESEGARNATASPRERDSYAKFGRTIAPLYTAPPSAVELVEALVKLARKWESEAAEETCGALAAGVRYCADALDALIAKHKENNRG